MELSSDKDNTVDSVFINYSKILNQKLGHIKMT